MTVYCTRVSYVDNCSKNSWYSCIQKHIHEGNMILLYCYCKGFLFRYHISIPLISSLTCLQIIKFCVLIQLWEDKTEVFQNSLSKNSWYSCIQKHIHEGNMILLYCYCKGFLFRYHISIPLISSLTCLQIIKFCVLIQLWEDKTEVFQNSLSRLNSGENISKLVDVICFSRIFDLFALLFFTKPLLYLCVPAND